MTITALAEAMEHGETTSYDLVTRYFERMDACARLRAVIERNPDAPELARARDRARGDGAVLGGVPILVKDNIDTGDRMHTTAGSVALAGNRAPRDAPLVARLREAGAVILGKTNMSEFANYMTGGRAPNGYSSRGGATLNPFDETADPSGSSTGSAVAVATGQCAAAIGTETCGSIISPSQHAGIVGLKPTGGLVPGAGIIPISPTLDTAGPMAACVADVAVVLGALTGRTYDLRRPEADLAGLRLGLVRAASRADDAAPGRQAQGSGTATEPSRAAWVEAAQRLVETARDSGVTWVDVALPPFDVEAVLLPIMRCEFKTALNAYLAAMHNPAIPQTLADVIAYNQAHADVALRYGQSELIAAEAASGTMTEPEYGAALAARQALVAALDAAFTRADVDVVLLLDADTDLAAVTGFPSLTLPLGRGRDGLPLGSGFIARRHREDALLRVAAALEARLGLWRVSGHT